MARIIQRYHYDRATQKYYRIPIRSIITNEMEIHKQHYSDPQPEISRVVVNDELIYAKGKVNFDLNLPEDAAGNIISWKRNGTNVHLTSVLAYYGEGFFENVYFPLTVYGGTTKSPFLGEELTFNNLTSEEATFDGWWTSKTGGTQITTVSGSRKSLIHDTDLFDEKDTAISLPEVTLYAHWTLKSFTVTVHNISRTGGGQTSKSSFIYNGKRINKTSTRIEVPYNTEIISYVNERFTDPKYVSWGAQYLSSTKKKQLNNGVQSFLGWTLADPGKWLPDKPGNPDNTGEIKILDSLNITTEDVHLYPAFKTIAIWKKTKFSGLTVGNKYKLYLDENSFTTWDDVISEDNPWPDNPFETFTDKKNRKFHVSWDIIYNPYRDTRKYDWKALDFIPYSSTIVCTLTRYRDD